MTAAEKLLIVARILQMTIYTAAFGVFVAYFAGAAAFAFGPTLTAWMLGLGILLFVGYTYLPRSGWK